MSDKCQEMDEQMQEQCDLPVGHEGPHDALGVPEDIEPEPVEDLELPDPPVEAEQPEQPAPTAPTWDQVEAKRAAPTSVPVDLDSLYTPPKETSWVMQPDRVAAFHECVGLAARNLAITGGESPEYAVGTTALIHPQDGQLIPHLVITMFVPSMNIGERIHMTGMLDNFYLDQDAVNAMVSDMVGQLVEARRTQADQMRAAANGLITGQE